MENISIELLDSKNKKQISHLKSYLDRQRISGLEKSEVKRHEIKSGEMGVGGIKNIIGATFDYTKSLAELLKPLFNYSFTFKTEIKLKINKLEIDFKVNKESVPQNTVDEIIDKINKNVNIEGNLILVIGSDNVLINDSDLKNVKIN